MSSIGQLIIILLKLGSPAMEAETEMVHASLTLAFPSVLVHTRKFATYSCKLDRSRRGNGRKSNNRFLPFSLPLSIRLCICLYFHGSHWNIRIIPSSLLSLLLLPLLVWTKFNRRIFSADTIMHSLSISHHAWNNVSGARQFLWSLGFDLSTWQNRWIHQIEQSNLLRENIYNTQDCVSRFTF